MLIWERSDMGLLRLGKTLGLVWGCWKSMPLKAEDGELSQGGAGVTKQPRGICQVALGILVPNLVCIPSQRVTLAKSFPLPGPPFPPEKRA